MQDFEPTTIEELITVLYGQEPADEYLKGLALLHKLQYGMLDDKINLMIAGDNGLDPMTMRAELTSGFYHAFELALKEHGISISPNTPFLMYYSLLEHILMMPGYEDPDELIACIDSNDDKTDILLELLTIMGLPYSMTYEDYIVFIEDTVITNLRKVLVDVSDSKVNVEELSDNFILAKDRLSLVPTEILEKSAVYQRCLDGYGVGYELNKDNHALLVSILKETDNVKDKVHESRIFLLASGVPTDRLMHYFSFIVDTLLPESATVYTLDLNEVGYY